MGYTPIRHPQDKNNEYRRVLTLRTIGNFLILSSLFMIIRTFYQPVAEEIKFYVETLVHKQYVVTQSTSIAAQIDKPVQKGLLAQVLNIKPVEALVPADPLFSVVIPKIGANSRVINTNAGDETQYLQTLKEGVAHADGTAYPGEGGNIFLFAHSTDYFWNVGTYNAVFYLLYKLEPNDEVNIFYQGHRFVYRVFEKKIIDPSEVHYLTDKTNREVLTLQTCWPPGTTLKRLLVLAQPVVR